MHILVAVSPARVSGTLQARVAILMKAFARPSSQKGFANA
jgi:hypothetical protein